MANEHQVVQLGAPADSRFADGGPIHTRIGLHLDVVFQHCRTGLQHLVPSAIVLMGKSKPVSADNHPVLQDHAIPNAAMLAHHSMSMREEVVSDLRAAVDSDEAVQHGIAAKFDVFVDITIGPNMRPIGNPGTFRDDRGIMNPGRIARRLIEELDRLSKCQIWIARAQRRKRRQRRLPLQRNSFFEQNRRSSRRLQ